MAEPLGLPVIGGFVLACFLKVSSNEAMVALSSLAGVVVTYYFRQREAETNAFKQT
jgi:hypothetical protein